MVSQCVGSVGPAGMLLADDTEMYERNQLGIESLTPEWLDVRRGLNRERVDENGFTVGGATDETGMRGFLVAVQDTDGGAMTSTLDERRRAGAGAGRFRPLRGRAVPLPRGPLCRRERLRRVGGVVDR